MEREYVMWGMLLLYGALMLTGALWETAHQVRAVSAAEEELWKHLCPDGTATRQWIAHCMIDDPSYRITISWRLWACVAGANVCVAFAMWGAGLL